MPVVAHYFDRVNANLPLGLHDRDYIGNDLICALTGAEAELATVDRGEDPDRGSFPKDHEQE